MMLIEMEEAHDEGTEFLLAGVQKVVHRVENLNACAGVE
jgi:hypothetical protein